MIITNSSSRPEAMVPPASLATDFDEWMAGWAFNWGGKRHNGEPIIKDALPGNAWRALSLRQEFLRSPLRSKSPVKAAPLFMTPFFEVRISPKGGYGAFATRDIEVGTLVMTEEPLLRAMSGDVFFEYERLTAEQRREYRSLYGWAELSNNPIISIFKTNRFELDGSRAGIFVKSSRFNHACRPNENCSFHWNKDLGQLVFTAIKPMKPGDEITIQYCSNTAKLQSNYGFFCDCPSCPDPNQAAANHRLAQRGW